VVEVVEVTDEPVWGVDHEVEIAPVVEELFDLTVVPEPEPEDPRSTEERIEDYQETQAKEQAWQYFMRTVTGTWEPLPDLSSWSERYRSVFNEELERLKTERRVEPL
jgi:hypothetical protein